MEESDCTSRMDKSYNNSDQTDDCDTVDWNDTKSVIEHNKQMLVHQMSCDVMFIAGEKKERIGAHKYVLMNQSKVFRNMFTGSNGNKFEYDIPDISADYFWELLRHAYCGDEKLQVSNVVGILYAADQFNMMKLRQACLQFLHGCLEVNNVCYLLAEARRFGYSEEEKVIMLFISKNASDVLKTKGMDILPRELLNEVLTLPGLDIYKTLRKEITDKWAVNHCDEKNEETNEDNIMDSLQDCAYVYRDDTASHRYVMDSLVSRNLFEDHTEPSMLSSAVTKTDDTDGMSTISSIARSMSSVHTYSRLSSSNMWADMDQVTRLQELYKSDINDATRTDAISFTVDHNLYLYGFSVYGPKKQGEGKFKVDTILYRKNREIVMESIHIKGAGVILPVMFERPVKIDKDYKYTLEVYIRGPESHMGASGQSQIQYGSVLFTFINVPKIKRNRTDTNKGQIPRLYFLVRQK